MSENKCLKLFKKISYSNTSRNLSDFFSYFNKFAICCITIALISALSIGILWQVYLTHQNGFCIHLWATSFFCIAPALIISLFFIDHIKEVFSFNYFKNKKEEYCFVFSLLIPFLYYHIIHSIVNNKNYQDNYFGGYYLHKLLKNVSFTELNCSSILDIKCFASKLAITKHITTNYKIFSYIEIKSIQLIIEKNELRDYFYFNCLGELELFIKNIDGFEKIKYQQELSKKINDFV